MPGQLWPGWARQRVFAYPNGQPQDFDGSKEKRYGSMVFTVFSTIVGINNPNTDWSEIRPWPYGTGIDLAGYSILHERSGQRHYPDHLQSGGGGLPARGQSVLAQSHREVEVIVVDDGSEDAARETIEDLTPVWFYLRQENAGVVAARNRGWRQLKENSSPFWTAMTSFCPGSWKPNWRLCAFTHRLEWYWTDMVAVNAEGREFIRNISLRCIAPTVISIAGALA